ncbi:hypothetical protein D3C76_1826350 [compost metagenome]
MNRDFMAVRRCIVFFDGPIATVIVGAIGMMAFADYDTHKVGMAAILAGIWKPIF